VKKVLISCGLILAFSTFAFGQTGITAKGFGSYGLLLNPEVEESGIAGEEMTKGGISFGGQVLYDISDKVAVGAEVAVGVEVGYLAVWKDEFTDPEYGKLVEASISAIPILGIIQANFPSAGVTPYVQAGAGIFSYKAKILLPDWVARILEEEAVQETTTSEFGVTAGGGIEIPVGPNVNLDLGAKIYMIFAADTVILLNPGVRVSVKF